MLNLDWSLEVEEEKRTRKNEVNFSPGFWCLYLIACNLWLFIAPGFYYPLIAKSITPKSVSPQVTNSCSQKSLETLTTQLMLDLPGYAN
ncbi:MAG: hypothetical protein ACK57R_18030, partial [Dolichospermum sp.]